MANYSLAQPLADLLPLQLARWAAFGGGSVDQTPVPALVAAPQTDASIASKVYQTQTGTHSIKFSPSDVGRWEGIVGRNADGTAGVGYQGVTANRFRLGYLDGNGAFVSILDYDFSTPITTSSVIEVVFDPLKKLYLSVDGVAILDRGTLDLATNNTPFGNYVKGSATGGATLKNVVAQDFALPLSSVEAPGIDSDGKTTWEIFWSGSPSGFAQRVTTTGSSPAVVSDWTRTLLIANAKGQGIAQSTYTAAQGDVLKYELRPMKSDGTVVMTGTALTANLARPARSKLGQGVARIHYTNMLMGSETKDANGDVYVGNPDATNSSVSERGDPRGTVDYYVKVPEVLGEVTLEYGCESGTLPPFTTLHTSGLRNYTQVGARRVQFTFDVDRRIIDILVLRITSVNMSDPPVGLYLTKAGADRTKLFDEDWLALMRKTPGANRHMDDLLANNPFLYNLVFSRADNATPAYMTFAHRSRIYRIGRQTFGIPLEALIRLHNELNVPVWFNVNSTFAYDYKNADGSTRAGTGRDYWRKMLRLMFLGEGSDTGEVLHSNAKHVFEPHNEAWNPALGTYHYLKTQHLVRMPGSTLGEYERVITERLYAFANIMEDIEAIVPNWQTRIDRTLGLQLGESDLGLMRLNSQWARADAHIDSYALAPYLPADPNAGTSPGDQPANNTPEAIVAWLRTYLKASRRTMRKAVQSALSEGRTMHIYEFNIAIPAIADRSKDIERALKKSAVFEAFCRDEYLPQCIMSVGGHCCVYLNEGTPVNAGQQTWYAREEGPPSYAGSGLWNAMVAVV